MVATTDRGLPSEDSWESKVNPEAVMASLRAWLSVKQVQGVWLLPAEIINVIDNLEAGTYEV